MFGGRLSSRIDVALLEPQLGRVLDRDDALVVGDERRQHVEQRRLAGAGAAADEDVEPAAHAGVEELGDLGASACRIATRSSTRRTRCGANLRMVSAGPSTASGGMIGVHAGAVGEAGVDHRRRLVDAAADRRDDAVDHPAQVSSDTNRASVVCERPARST